MYEHMQIRNCNNLHVVGDAVMYNSLARLPFTQATIVGVSKNARDLTFQVIARAGYHACCPARSLSHVDFFHERRSLCQHRTVPDYRTTCS